MGALSSNLSRPHEKQGAFAGQKPIDVAIIGAGASGVLLALALARHAPEVAVTLIDPAPNRGPARPRPSSVVPSSTTNWPRRR